MDKHRGIGSVVVIGFIALALLACGGKPVRPSSDPVQLTATRALVGEVAEAAPDVAATIQEHLGGIEQRLTAGDADGAATHVVALLPVLHDERLPPRSGSQIWVSLSDELMLGAEGSKVPKLTVTDHPGMNCDATNHCTIPDPAWNCQEVFEGGVHKGCALRPVPPPVDP